MDRIGSAEATNCYPHGSLARFCCMDIIFILRRCPLHVVPLSWTSPCRLTLFLFLAALSSWLTTAFLPSCVVSVYHPWLMFPLNPFLPFIPLSVSLCVLLAVSLSPFVWRLIQVCLRYLV